jgi:hypothetical protein
MANPKGARAAPIDYQCRSVCREFHWLPSFHGFIAAYVWMVGCFATTFQTHRPSWALNAGALETESNFGYYPIDANRVITIQVDGRQTGQQGVMVLEALQSK